MNHLFFGITALFQSAVYRLRCWHQLHIFAHGRSTSATLFLSFVVSTLHHPKPRLLANVSAFWKRYVAVRHALYFVVVSFAPLSNDLGCFGASACTVAAQPSVAYASSALASLYRDTDDLVRPSAADCHGFRHSAGIAPYSISSPTSISILQKRLSAGSTQTQRAPQVLSRIVKIPLLHYHLSSCRRLNVWIKRRWKYDLFTVPCSINLSSNHSLFRPKWMACWSFLLSTLQVQWHNLHKTGP